MKTAFDKWNGQLRTTVRNVLGDDSRYSDLCSRLELNVSRFAAYKSYDMQQKIDALDKSNPDYAAHARTIAGTYNGYMEAEIKAAVTRSRNARNWTEFEEHAETFPNLRWLSSNAVLPREEHRPFYGKVIPKSDPFWNANQPGNIWGCKCGWEETDAPADIPAQSVPPSPGLAGNPAHTGEVFSRDASYFKRHAANDTAAQTIGNLYYSDNKSAMKISALADHREIADNVRTGKILLKNFNDMKLSIRPHFFQPGVKNPEYEVNGLIADAKRINKFSGVSDGFNKAKKQNSKVLILDLHNIESKGLKIDIAKLASGIVNRNADFHDGTIKECYVVWGDKCVKIDGEMFREYDHHNKGIYTGRIKDMLYDLQK